MSFLRTNSGLSNQAIFRDVDVVVYTEGGNTVFSVQDVAEGHYNKHANDTIFWHGLLKKQQFGNTYTLYPIGSKNTVLEIANRLEQNLIINVVVAMDTDTDDIYKQKLSSPMVLYTYGYSWENDVFSPEVLVNYIEQSILDQSSVATIAQDINEAWSVSVESLIELMRFYLTEREARPNEKIVSNINRFMSKSSKPPRIEKELVNNFLSTNRNSIGVNNNFKKVFEKYTVKRYLYGKWLLQFFYVMFLYVGLQHKFFKSKISKEHFVRDFLERYFRITEPTNYNYYKTIIEQLELALEQQNRNNAKLASERSL